MGWISKSTPFRLIDIDEQITGSDKMMLNNGFAFYMQFKKSKGLKSISEIASSTRKNRSALEDIREFRHKKHLPDDPTLYFKLREKAQHAYDYQHNILLKFANQAYSQAFYVAPLILDKEEYYRCLFDSANRYVDFPFYYYDLQYHVKNWISYISYVPILKNHISIIPHESVNTCEHYYSYSTVGTDIGWHSPELLSERPSRLSDILSQELFALINNTERFVPLNQLYGAITSIYEAGDITYNSSLLDDITDIERLQVFGRELYKNYGIRQLICAVNIESINKLK